MASLNHDYAHHMRHHPYGYALFHPVSTADLKPGSVGFFDNLGYWNPIVNLDNPKSLEKQGLVPPSEALERAPSERIKKWTPKTSLHAKQNSLGTSLGTSGILTGLPVDAHLAVEYKSSTDYGAVLISSSPVTREGFYYKAPFKEWVKLNARSLLHGHLAEDIKEYGLFVVTQTHAARKCALTAWRSVESRVHFGFGIGATGLAEISPDVGWYEGSSESGWNVHEAEGDDLQVVFAGGLSFRRIPASKSHFRETRSPSRGGDELGSSISVSIIGEEEAVLDCEVWGTSIQDESVDSNEEIDNEDDDEDIDD